MQRHGQNPELLAELAEMIARDRKTQLTADDVPQTLGAWAQEKAITNRGLYVSCHFTESRVAVQWRAVMPALTSSGTKQGMVRAYLEMPVLGERFHNQWRRDTGRGL